MVLKEIAQHDQTDIRLVKPIEMWAHTKNFS